MKRKEIRRERTSYTLSLLIRLAEQSQKRDLLVSQHIQGPTKEGAK